MACKMRDNLYHGRCIQADGLFCSVQKFCFSWKQVKTQTPPLSGQAGERRGVLLRSRLQRVLAASGGAGGRLDWLSGFRADRCRAAGGMFCTLLHGPCRTDGLHPSVTESTSQRQRNAAFRKSAQGQHHAQANGQNEGFPKQALHIVGTSSMWFHNRKDNRRLFACLHDKPNFGGCQEEIQLFFSFSMKCTLQKHFLVV